MHASQATDPASPAVEACDEALALLLSDGAAAARRAAEVLQQPEGGRGRAALAHAVLALVELREGDAQAGVARLQQAQALQDDSAVGDRAAGLIEHGWALAARRDGRLEQAEALLTPLHARADARDPLDACLCAAALGIVRSMRGDDVAALDLFYQALALARRSGHASLVVNALNNLGSHQSDQYNLDDAWPLLEECLTGALALGSRRQVIYAAGNLVQCLCLMGQAGRALEVAQQHLIGHIHADDPPALHRDEEIAQVLLDNGQVDAAEAALGGPEHIDPMSNELATIRVWLRARILLARGQAGPALQLCLARRQMLAQTGGAGTIAIDLVNLQRTAAQSAHRLGEHELAYRLLEEASATHERVLGRAARSRQLSLQITHRLRQAEWERDAARQMAARMEALNASLQAQIAETERLQERLRAQALEDPLTGLYNRRHLMDAGAALLALLRRRGEPLAVAVVDLDRFKQVNDLHGHEAGDRVLQAFAATARRCTRAGDIACRWGGEEFVLLLPGAGVGPALERLGHLLKQFGALRFASPTGEPFTCTFSAGLAVTGDPAEDLPAVLARADAALYGAKQAGRCCIHAAPQPGPAAH